MANILGTGVSALNAFKRQLATVGHNIANVNTEGYSRQRVELGTLAPQEGSDGFTGSGVQVRSIRRSYDDYLAGRVRAYSATREEYAIYRERAARVDEVIADSASGLDGMMQDFFRAVEDVTADPASIPARNVMLDRSEVLADRFRSLSGWLDDLRAQTNRDLENFVSEVNGLGESIASVNRRIQGLSAGIRQPPNDLLDERDRLIDRLSEYVKVTTVPQDDGALNVFIGNGQALVVGDNASRLKVQPDPSAADHREIAIELPGGGGSAVVTRQISGGRLGGLLRFRDEVLDPAQNALGLVAAGLADRFNAVHATGMNLNGGLGGDYFSISGPEALGVPGNTGALDARIDDLSALRPREYLLDFDGANWNARDAVTGEAVAISGTGTAADPLLVEGVALVVSAAPAAGDRWRLRPVRSAASEIAVRVRDTREIAAADPIRAADAPGNAGTAHIGAGKLVTRTGSTLPAAPVTLTWNAALGQFDLSTGGAIPYDPAVDSGSELTVSLAGLGDFRFTMTGTPADGDRFVLEDNTGGVGDNRNALALSAVQTESRLFDGGATLGDAYGYLVADVGTRTRQAADNADVQGELLAQADAARSAVSGVNLDEEAADLVRFQQAYAAAAQVISTANTLFETLLGAVRS